MMGDVAVIGVCLCHYAKVTEAATMENCIEVSHCHALGKFDFSSKYFHLL